LLLAVFYSSYEPPGPVPAVYPSIDSRLPQSGSSLVSMEAKRLDKSHIYRIAHMCILRNDRVRYLAETEDLDVLEDTCEFEELLIWKMSIH
jgi:hypothetical protein